jgi:magnesium transporter
MNMTFPELQLLGPAAYPYVIALMVASALVPMIYFRKRGWLK